MMSTTMTKGTAMKPSIAEPFTVSFSGASNDDRKADLASRLHAISEDLTELAVESLKDAVREGHSDEARAEERLIARARRSVDKAAGILQGRG